MRTMSSLLLVLGALVLRSSALAVPRAPKMVTQAEAEKPHKEQDLDALDAASAEVDEAMPASARSKPPAPHTVMTRTLRAPRARVAGEVVPRSVAKLSSLGAAHADDFTVSDSAEAVLDYGDELAHKKEVRKQRQALMRVAPARVVRVNRTDEKAAEAHEIEGTNNLEKDLAALHGQQAAVAEKARSAAKERAEEAAEETDLEARHEAHEAHTIPEDREAPARNGTDLGKLAALSSKAQAAADAQIPGKKKSLSLARINSSWAPKTPYPTSWSYVDGIPESFSHGHAPGFFGKVHPAHVAPKHIADMGSKLEGDYEAMETAAKGRDDEEKVVPDRELRAMRHLRTHLRKMRVLEDTVPKEVIPQPKSHAGKHPKKQKPAAAAASAPIAPKALEPVWTPWSSSQADRAEQGAPDLALANHTTVGTQVKIAAKTFKERMHSHVEEMHKALKMHEVEIKEQALKDAQRAVEQAEQRKELQKQQAEDRLKAMQKRHQDAAERLVLEKVAREANTTVFNMTKTVAHNEKHTAHDMVIAYRARQRAKKAAEAKKVADKLKVAEATKANNTNATKTKQASTANGTKTGQASNANGTNAEASATNGTKVQKANTTNGTKASSTKVKAPEAKEKAIDAKAKPTPEVWREGEAPPSKRAEQEAMPHEYHEPHPQTREEMTASQDKVAADLKARTDALVERPPHQAVAPPPPQQPASCGWWSWATSGGKCA